MSKLPADMPQEDVETKSLLTLILDKIAELWTNIQSGFTNLANHINDKTNEINENTTSLLNNINSNSSLPLNEQIANRPIVNVSGQWNSLDTKGGRITFFDCEYQENPSTYFVMNDKTGFYIWHHQKNYYGNMENNYILEKYELVLNKKITINSQKEDSKALKSLFSDWCFCNLENKSYGLFSKKEIRCLDDLTKVVISLPEEATIFYLKNESEVYFINTESILKKYHVEGLNSNLTIIRESMKSAIPMTGTAHMHWSYKEYWYYLDYERKINKINMNSYEIEVIETGFAISDKYNVWGDYSTPLVIFTSGANSVSATYDCNKNKFFRFQIGLSLPLLDTSEGNKENGISGILGCVAGFLIPSNISSYNYINRSYYRINIRKWDFRQYTIGEKNKLLFLKKGFKLKVPNFVEHFDPNSAIKTYVPLPEGIFIATEDCYIVDDGRIYTIEEV